MSSKKDKLIEEAQRLAIRGQLDKAIKIYEQVMAIEPSALSHRQRLAELLLKAGRAADARTEFETIGKYYSSNGFYLKGIAVYKQLQKFFPGDIPITLILAELNEKHGLVANALEEYRLVFDLYEKSSDMEEALRILVKMQSVDPQNIAVRLKLAETYFQIKRSDDSYTAFRKLASLLQERGDTAALGKLDARIRQLFPEKTDFMLDVLSEQVSTGNVAGAVSGLQVFLRTNPKEKRAWELIIEAYKKLNQPQKEKMAYQHYLSFFPDEISARTGLIACHAAEHDVRGALALLDEYEQEILSSGNHFDDLEAVYKTLEVADPINERVLDGLSRIYQAAGRTGESDALAPRLESLKHLTETGDGVPPSSDESVFTEEASFGQQTPIPEVFSPEPTDMPGELFDTERAGDAAFDSEIPSAFSDEIFDEPAFGEVDVVDAPEDSGEELEIEVEFDDFEAVDIASTDDDTGRQEDNWLDSVGEILESISTTPRGVRFDSSLDGADAQSHYDLGMAFREMGLFDEAINEFRQASSDPARRLGCLIFQGACLRDKGDLKNADTVLRSLLKPGLDQEDFLSAKYELALTCKAALKNDEFARMLAEIETVSPGYRDVRSLIAEIGTEKNDLDFSEEDFKGFGL